MITAKDLIIGFVTTKSIVNSKKRLMLPGTTFPVVEIVQVHGLTCYITNKVHKVHSDGTYEPLIIMENLVKEYIPKP